MVPNMDAAQRFGELVSGDDWIPVDEGALLIALQLDGDRDLDHERQRLDAIAAQVREPTLDGLRHLLFDDLGFTGDRASYYDPQNSMLPAVLDRRLGIPISLSVLMIAVGRRIGVPLDGVGMPGHFLLRDRVDPEVFIDAFAGGRELDRAACEAMVDGFDPAWLEPVPPRAILMRMLNNLRAIYSRGHRAQLVKVLELATLLSATEAPAYAAVLVAQGRFDKAADVYDTLDERDRANALRARLN